MKRKCPARKLQLPNECMLIHCEGWQIEFAPRSKRRFQELIRKSFRTNEKPEPIRLDVHETECEAFRSAVNGRYGWLYSLHKDELRDSAGFARFAVFPPNREMPQLKATRSACHKDREADRRRVEKEKVQLLYTEEEILLGFSQTAYDHRWLEPDAEKARHDHKRSVDSGKKGRGVPRKLSSEGKPVAEYKGQFDKLVRDTGSERQAAELLSKQIGISERHIRRVLGISKR